MENKFNELFPRFSVATNSKHDYGDPIDKPKKKKSKKKEQSVQAALSAHIRNMYPDVVFTAEASGVRLTMGQATQAMGLRSRHKQPDMTVLVPRGNYHAFIIELKAEEKSPILRNGSFSTDKHVKEQRATLQHLASQGYYATFGVGYEKSKALFDKYMSLRPGESMDVVI